jgi:hypothetical protein
VNRTRYLRAPRRSGTPRIKGGTRIISHDGTVREEPADFASARATVRKGEGRKYRKHDPG